MIGVNAKIKINFIHLLIYKVFYLSIAISEYQFLLFFYDLLLLADFFYCGAFYCNSMDKRAMR